MKKVLILFVVLAMMIVIPMSVSSIETTESQIECVIQSSNSIDMDEPIGSRYGVVCPNCSFSCSCTTYWSNPCPNCGHALNTYLCLTFPLPPIKI